MKARETYTADDTSGRSTDDPVVNAAIAATRNFHLWQNVGSEDGFFSAGDGVNPETSASFSLSPCRRPSSASAPTNSSQSSQNRTSPAESERWNTSQLAKLACDGTDQGEVEVKSAIKNAYERLVNWRRNAFNVPFARSGKAYVDELARLIQTFADGKNTTWVRLETSLCRMPPVAAAVAFFRTFRQICQASGEEIALVESGTSQRTV